MIYALLAFWTIFMIGAAVAIHANLRDLKRQKQKLPVQTVEHGEALFFENGMLINASPEVKGIFADLDIPAYRRGMMWTIWALLGDDFSLPTEDGKFVHEGAFSTEVFLKVEGEKITIQVLSLNGPAHFALYMAISAFLSKVYRSLCEASPTAMSVTNLDGEKIIENTAFVRLAELLDLDQMIDVPERIESGDAIAVQASAQKGSAQMHFDVNVARKDGFLNFDIRDSSDRHVVHQNVQTFRRTMTQTFADLSVGLGVFDKDQHLITFNPALVDLLGLPITFLTQRPSMFSFFAHLRESNVMPEPENFGQWQDNLLRMVNDASDGVFNEVWYGLEGRALRVMGRPHPSGGFSFLVEDISKDIALQKNTKSQLRAQQNMIDKISIPMAAFDNEGLVIAKNAAFEALLEKVHINLENADKFSEIMHHLNTYCTVNTSLMPDNGTLVWTEEAYDFIAPGVKKNTKSVTVAAM